MQFVLCKTKQTQTSLLMTTEKIGENRKMEHSIAQVHIAYIDFSFHSFGKAHHSKLLHWLSWEWADSKKGNVVSARRILGCRFNQSRLGLGIPVNTNVVCYFRWMQERDELMLRLHIGSEIWLLICMCVILLSKSYLH